VGILSLNIESLYKNRKLVISPTTIVTIKKYLTTPLSVATKHFQVNEAYISKLC